MVPRAHGARVDVGVGSYDGGWADLETPADGVHIIAFQYVIVDRGGRRGDGRRGRRAEVVRRKRGGGDGVGRIGPQGSVQGSVGSGGHLVAARPVCRPTGGSLPGGGSGARAAHL
jgi:hypothetical protein